MKFSTALLAISAVSTVLALPAVAPASEELAARQEPEVSAAPVEVPTPSVEPQSSAPAASESPVSVEVAPSSSATSEAVTAAPSETPTATETTPTSSAPAPSTSIYENGSDVGTVFENEDGWLVYKPMDRSQIEARAVEDAFNLFPEVPLLAEPSAQAEVGEGDEGFTLSNAERIKRGLKPRRPAKLWSGRAPQSRPAGNHFRPRDATGSAIPCSGNGASGGLLANTCTNGSVCLISTNDCTQVASPAQAQSGQGSDACFASCQPGSCYTAAYTKEGRCLIFAKDCCLTAP